MCVYTYILYIYIGINFERNYKQLCGAILCACTKTCLFMYCD